MSEFLFYSVDTFLKTIDCYLYGLQRLELNKIGTKRTMGVLNICHRPVVFMTMTHTDIDYNEKICCSLLVVVFVGANSQIFCVNIGVFQP